MDKMDFLNKAMMEKRLAIGGHVFLTDPSISEAMAGYGYDFIWIDGEHGPFDKEKLLAHIVATNAGGAAALVRVPANDPVLIKPVLEMGPDGIIIPMVLNAEEARKAVSACLYPPAGIRGFGPRRANRYGMIPIGSYLESADRAFLKIIQIEHIAAVRDIEAILGVKGLDAIIIGPNDLSASIGKLGKLKDPEVVALYDKIVGACRRLSMPCGVSIGPGDEGFIREWIARGIDFISCGDDISFMAAGALKTIDLIQSCPRKSF